MAGTSGSDVDAKIDQIVDDLVKDEETASELKSKLHESLETDVPSRFSESAEPEDDEDDLWDNMPV